MENIIAKNLLLDKTCSTCMEGQLLKCESSERAVKEYNYKTNTIAWRDFSMYGLEIPSVKTCKYYRGN